MPAAAVIQRVQALSGFIGRKAFRRWFGKLNFKDPGLTRGRGLILQDLENFRGNRNCWCRGEIR